MSYTGNLGKDLSDLYDFSPKSQDKVFSLIGQAKAALGIEQLTETERSKIYQWHFDRVQNIKQTDTVKPPVATQSTKPVSRKIITLKARPATDFKQVDVVQFCEVEAEPVNNSQQTDIPEAVQYLKQVDNYDVIHFGVTLQPKSRLKQSPRRSTIALEGYFVRALVRKYGFRDNAAVRQWIEARVVHLGGIDTDTPKLTATTQIKRIIIEAIV